MGLSKADKVDLLKIEYQKLTDEQRMYIQQYTPTLNVFGVTVLAGFVTALVNTKYQAIFPLLPFVIFMVTYLGIGQTHMVAALGLRIRAIEETLREMNGGEPILEWEHNYAQILVFALWVRLPLRDPQETMRFLNPLLVSTLYMVLAGSILVIGCCFKAFPYIDTTYSSFWAWAYVTIIVFVTIFMAVQAFVFFRMGLNAPRVNIRSVVHPENNEGEKKN